MPATEATLTSRYGAYFARATMARNILAPVAGTLRGHPSELHRRCILVRRLPSCTVPGEVCDMFASIEAIAVSGGLGMAVVVFGVAVADCMSAAVLRTGAGFFEPVPPLHLGPPLVLAAAMDIKGDRRGRPVEATTALVASLASRREGPTPGGADGGEPRYYGTSYTYWRTDDTEFFCMEDASRRAADLGDPHKIPDKIWPYQYWFD
uniref:Uncharacterized protein n=1 Tax=Oryza sativa subsp. japonica TaxID=39947 RepID=Q8GRN1_ORYSJ|nr:hypothetical protein [Oryza sativa Japonica Group]BAC22348.1 hypothetical protein [Oryza sativa Japonica Group]